MRSRLAVVALWALCFAVLGVSASALPQNPPPIPPPSTPPPPPPPPLIQGGRGVAGGVVNSQPGRSAQPPPPLVATGLLVGRVVDPASGKGVGGAIVTLNGGPARTPIPVQPGARPAPPPPPAGPLQILTDAEGRFAFTSLFRGNYTLTTTKTGYAPGAYGRMRPGGPTRSLQLDDGEKLGDVTVRLFKFGSISGTVVDDTGEPVVQTMIRVYRRTLVAGRRVLMPTGPQVQTDDRGAYRIGSLAPGEFVVVAPVIPVTVPAMAQGAGSRQNFQASMQGLTSSGPIPGAGGQTIAGDSRFLLQRTGGANGEVAAAPDADGRVLGFATVYYPNAPTVSGAQPISLGSGEERSGIDLQLRRVPTVAVSGQILGLPGAAADFVVRMTAADNGEIFQEPESAITMSDGAGSFMFLAVPAGQYVLQVVRVPRPNQNFEDVRVVASGGQWAAAPPAQAPTAEPLLWATAPLSVSDTDVHGVALTLREGLTISGRLEFSGSRPRPTPQSLTQIPVVVEPADGRPQMFSSGPPSRVQQDGRFVTAGQLPGRYFIRIGGAPGGWYVQSIMAGGIDATETPIDLSSGAMNNVIVTFTDQFQDVRGTVTGNPAGADPPVVVVFPADSTAWKNFGVNPQRMRTTRAATTGAFTLGSLPAGDYYAVAIPEEYSSEWQDPAYLELLSRAAMRFGLNPAERKTLDIQVHDVKPPGIGRVPAPQPIPIPPESRSSFAIDSGHGPFVADDAPQQVRDTRTVTTAGRGSISGVVRLDDGSQKPARFARVSVRNATTPGEHVALTDNEGRYSVVGLPPGSYQVTVSKPAYLTMTYGARRPLMTPGIAVKVEPGQAVAAIDVVLKRGGVVTGVILGADGEPAAGVRVQLMQRVMVDGDARLSGAPSGGQSVTDDRGSFRLFGLRPGTYAIAAIPPSNVNTQSEIRQLSDQEIRAAFAEAAAAARSSAKPAAAGRQIPAAPPGPLPAVPPIGRAVGFAPVYYPSTTMEDQAGMFSVTAGTEARVTIALQHVPTARIEGTVVTADGQPAPIQGMQLMLQRSTSMSTSNSAVRMLENGAFQAMGVAPGRYQLTARLTEQGARPTSPPGNPQASPTPTQWVAQQEIDVVGVDVSGITLTLAPPIAITGRVVFEGGTPPGDAQVQVRLDAAGRNPVGSFARMLKAADNGEFTIANVMPGRYRLNASFNIQMQPGGPMPLPPAWALKSATVEGRDAMETPFEVQAGRAPQSIVVTLTSRLPQLTATITDKAGQNVPNMTFVLFSANREHWTGQTSRRLRSQSRPTDEGQFQFGSVLPGEYYLAVLTDLEPGDLYDPQFLEQLIPAAIKITLAEGDKKVQNLRIAGTSSGTSGASGTQGASGSRNLQSYHFFPLGVLASGSPGGFEHRLLTLPQSH